MKIYKITEASEYLGVSINTLKTLANNCKIKSFKTTGAHRRFREDDLDTYMGVEKEKQEKLTYAENRGGIMNKYSNENSGALFKNDKGGVDTRPDYKGPINVNGVDMDIAAWLRVDKNGKKYMSLKIGPKRETSA